MFGAKEGCMERIESQIIKRSLVKKGREEIRRNLERAVG